MDNTKNSILNSVKKMIASDSYFDTDLIIHINTTFARLQQMGIGPEGGFAIEDESTEWSEYTNDEPIQNMVKTYMVLQVKLLFDISTASSTLIQEWNTKSAELEWRLNSVFDYNSK